MNMSFIGKKIKKLILSQWFFERCQKQGIHVMDKNYYSPIPDTRHLRSNEELWHKESQLPGVDMNVTSQLKLLEEVFSQYKNEYNFPIDETDVPCEFYLNCPNFGYQPAAILHSMIRRLKPRNVIEIGSGSSTFVSARACEMNRREGNPAVLSAIEPYPNEVLKQGFPGLSELIEKKVEEVELNVFSQLQANDILFIDSSHVVRIGGDVNFLYLDVLPRLNKGVFIHIHDIFFPMEHPKDWIVDKRRFFTEQYLLQAFLCFNIAFEVVFSNYYMNLHFPDKLAAVFPLPEGFDEFHYPSSFWLKKVV